MPYCPSCRYEFKPNVSVCPDCNEQLVPELAKPSGASQPDDSWIGICRVSGGYKGDLARGALDSNNIPSMVMSSSFNSIGTGDAHLGKVLTPGDIVMVPREFKDEATLILEAVLGEDFQSVDQR